MEERFEIRDKRRIDQAGEIRDVQHKKEQAQPAQTAGKPAESQHQKEHAHHHHHAAEEAHGHEAAGSGANFAALVMNLAAMAYMAMGLGDVPSAPNLGEAMYIIDSIDMLEKKTKGNLTPDEEKTVKAVLYELKMNFSKLAPGGISKI
ncbi:MAG: DUF1844 domain-containing protein [Nitrospiraceae bacterium]|nr:DUF1844 domain-containing protein [Nitrospiraceae bacterium]